MTTSSPNFHGLRFFTAFKDRGRSTREGVRYIALIRKSILKQIAREIHPAVLIAFLTTRFILLPSDACLFGNTSTELNQPYSQVGMHRKACKCASKCNTFSVRIDLVPLFPPSRFRAISRFSTLTRVMTTMSYLLQITRFQCSEAALGSIGFGKLM